MERTIQKNARTQWNIVECWIVIPGSCCVTNWMRNEGMNTNTYANRIIVHSIVFVRDMTIKLGASDDGDH